MNRIRLFATGFLLLSMHFAGNAQGLDAETGFIYVKAEYLFETGRYDEAISSYNEVVARDSMYKDALIHRGLAKYALAAYAGAKKDALRSIELKGISADAAALLGRTFAVTRNFKAAIQSYSAAIALDARKVEFFEWRGEAYEMDGQQAKACKDYEAAMQMGSAAGESKSRSLCGYKARPQTQKEQSPPVVNTQPQQSDDSFPPAAQNQNAGTQIEQPQQQTTQPASSENTGTPTVDDSEPMAEQQQGPAEDFTVNKVEVDEDLYIEISGQGLGKRNIKEIPSIIILPDEAGKVTVNFCVNREGRVITAEYNAQLSTINKKSLVTFAIRKAQEFEFSAGEYDSQCGIMVFHILQK